LARRAFTLPSGQLSSQGRRDASQVLDGPHRLRLEPRKYGLQVAAPRAAVARHQPRVLVGAVARRSSAGTRQAAG